MSSISTENINKYSSKMRKGKSISFAAVRKFAKGGRVQGAGDEELKKDIAEMKKALLSSRLSKKSKASLSTAIVRAERLLKSKELSAEFRKANPSSKDKALSNLKVAVGDSSLIKKAINANTPKGQPDADKMMATLRKKNAARKKKTEKKRLEVNKAKFAHMDEAGTTWPKSSKTGEREKPKRKRPAIKKKKK